MVVIPKADPPLAETQDFESQYLGLILVPQPRRAPDADRSVQESLLKGITYEVLVYVSMWSK